MAYHMQLGPLPREITDLVFDSLDGLARMRVLTFSKSYIFYFWSRLATKHHALELVISLAENKISAKCACEAAEAILWNANLLRWCRESTEMTNAIDYRRLHLPREFVESGIFTLTYPIGYNIDQYDHGMYESIRKRLHDPDVNATAAFNSILSRMRSSPFNMNEQVCRAVTIAASLLDAPTFSLFAVQDDLASFMRTYRPIASILEDLSKLFDHPDFDPCAGKGAWVSFLLGSDMPEIQPLMEKLVKHPRFRNHSLDATQALRWIQNRNAGPYFVQAFASGQRDLREWYSIAWVKILHGAQIYIPAVKSVFEMLTHEEHVDIALLAAKYGLADLLRHVFRTLQEVVKLDQTELVQRAVESNTTEGKRSHAVYGLFTYGFVDAKTAVSAALPLCKIDTISAFNTVNATKYSFEKDGYDVLRPLVDDTDGASFNIAHFLRDLKKNKTGGFDADKFLEQVAPEGSPRRNDVIEWLREPKKEKKKPSKKRKASKSSEKPRRNPKRTNWNEAWEEAKKKVKEGEMRGYMLTYDIGDDSNDEDFVPE